MHKKVVKVKHSREASSQKVGPGSETDSQNFIRFFLSVLSGDLSKSERKKNWTIILLSLLIFRTQEKNLKFIT